MADRKKSNTTYLELPAEFEWAKIFPENYDKTGPNGAYESHGGAYTIDGILTKEVFKQLKDAGSQATALVPYEDNWYTKKKIDELTAMDEEEETMPSYAKLFAKADKVKVKFKRKHDAPYTYGGAPQVAHVDGTPWDIDEDGLIGNGSKGILYVSVYEAGGLKGTRLDGIQVLEHVEYQSDYDEDAGGGGFKIPDRTAAQTTKPKKPTKATASKKTEEVEDEEIPF